MIDRVVDLLALEFDTEQWHPLKAILALSRIGERAVPKLIAYLMDRGADTFRARTPPLLWDA